MIKKVITIILIFVLMGIASIPPVFAQSAATYTWQYLSPQNITTANDLKTEIESEVQKVINAGHLAPFRAGYGEIRNPSNGQFYWYHRYDTIYTLSLAYPYLSSSTQTAVKSYMQTDMTAYPLWNATLLDAQTGTKREPDELTTAERGNLPAAYPYTTRPKLFALYALWLYANNTGDWAYINNTTNWNSIKSFYSSNSAEINQHYTSIAGAIGYARMAQQRSPQDTAARDAAVTAITNGLNNGKNFTQFATNTFNSFLFDGGEGWRDYMWNGMFLGFQFLDITPEIGRYMTEDSTLKAAVLGASRSDKYSLARVEYYWPIWYMAQAPVGGTYFGEGSGNPPDTRGMVFPLKAWVQKEPASQLRKYLDVPDALIGDYYYMQNIIRTIEASGTECWEDVTTTQQECNSSITPPPSSPTPTTGVPTPTPVPGDVSGDRLVTLIDLSTLLSHFGQSGTGIGRAQGDLDGNSSVNLTDLSQLLANFGK